MLDAVKNLKKMYYSMAPNPTEEGFYSQAEVFKYTKAYQDQIIQLGENTFEQYQYKIDLHKEGRTIIINTDYRVPEDGSRILTQKYGGIENCYVNYIGMVNPVNLRNMAIAYEASRSYIPSKSSCFVATATYHDAYHPNVVALRRYRDETLSQTKLGRLFVAFYYKVGPFLAYPVKHSSSMNKMTRKLLDLLVSRLR